MAKRLILATEAKGICGHEKLGLIRNPSREPENVCWLVNDRHFYAADRNNFARSDH